MKKELSIKRIALVFLVGISVLSALYTAMTFGQTYVHSDNATPLRFLNSIIQHKSLFPKTWNTANGETYSFHNMVPAVLTSFLMKNESAARALSSVISIALACGAMFWFSKKFLNNDSWGLSIPMFCVFLCSDNARDMILYHAGYTTQMIAVSFCVGIAWMVIVENYGSKCFKLLFMVLIFVMTIDGIRYIAEYHLPFTLAVFIFLFATKKIKSSVDVIKRGFVNLGAPSLVAFIFYLLLCMDRNMNFSSNSSVNLNGNIQFILHNAKETAKNLITIWGYKGSHPMYYNSICIFAALLICVIIPVVKLIQYKDTTEREKGYLFFFIVHNGIMLTLAIVGGKITERYLLSSIYTSILLSSNYIYSHLKTRKISVVFLGIFSCITILQCVLLFRVTIGWKDILASEKRVGQVLVDNNIGKVYATYWNAYAQEVYSDDKVIAGAVRLTDRKLEKYHWLVDDYAFRKVDCNSCVILDENENELFNSAIYIQLGNPDDVIQLDSVYAYDLTGDRYVLTNYYIYLFSRDIADEMSDGFRDGMVDVKEMEFNWMGTMTEDSIIMTQGGIIHGPFSQIDKGDYKVFFDGKNLDAAEYGVCSDLSPNSVQFQFEKIEPDIAVMTLHVEERVDDLQFILQNPSAEEIDFYYIRIEKE